MDNEHREPSHKHETRPVHLSASQVQHQIVPVASSTAFSSPLPVKMKAMMTLTIAVTVMLTNHINLLLCELHAKFQGKNLCTYIVTFN